MESRIRGEKRSLQSFAGSPSEADGAVRRKHPRRVFRFAERQGYSRRGEDLPQLLQAQFPSCRPFGFHWFALILYSSPRFTQIRRERVQSEAACQGGGSQRESQSDRSSEAAQSIDVSIRGEA